MYLLGRHPQISFLPSEGVRLTDQLPRPEDFVWHRLWCRCLDEVRLPVDTDTPLRCERIRKQWALALPTAPECVVEKFIANTARLPFLQAGFTPAYFTYPVHNGFAVAEGIRRKTDSRRYGNDEFGDSYPMDLCAEQWRVSHDIVAADQANLEHFLQITSEELTGRPDQVLARITQFLQLPALGADAAVDTFRVHGVVSPIRNMNAESIARLTPEKIDAIRQTAGPVLEKFGYEPD